MLRISFYVMIYYCWILF